METEQDTIKRLEDMVAGLRQALMVAEHRVTALKQELIRVKNLKTKSEKGMRTSSDENS